MQHGHPKGREGAAYLNRQGNHAAHAIGQAWSLLADPQCIADHDELGAFKPVQVAFHSFLKAIAAILLFPLKYKGHIDWQAAGFLLLHFLHCMYESQNGPLQSQLRSFSTRPHSISLKSIQQRQTNGEEQALAVRCNGSEQVSRLIFDTCISRAYSVVKAVASAGLLYSSTCLLAS